jgi:ketosteroid isomerase-like protein
MQSTPDAVRGRARTVRHFDLGTGRPFDEFRAAYEAAVPHFDRLEAIGVALSGAGWTAVQGLSAATAPHGFVNFFTFDPSPVMAVNGHTGRGVTYLTGNIVKAEAGFGIDPSCFLYIPLRVAIAADSQGNARLSFDHPGDLFAVFGDPRLDAVAADFSTSFWGLLRYLGLPVPGADAGPSEPELPEGDLVNAARQFLSALGGRDWDAMRRLVAPQATWTFPGDARISGTARGVDAIIAKATAMTSGGVHIEVEHVLAGTTGGAFVLHNTAADGSGALDQYLVSTLNVGGGQIDRIETFLSEPSKIASYFGR